jgi:putative phage-type endonuclease
MALQRISYPDRESWLAGRSERGIGASEAAAVCGMSPWLSKNELWELKRGIRKAKDISDNAEVQRGVNMEGAVRNFFSALHPEYGIEYHPYDILFQEERPWLFATLDGELLADDGKTGILEIKTASPNGRASWAEWEGKVPGHYYAQLCHQLLSTGYDFAVLQAALWTRSRDIILREYRFDRTDCEEDITWLLAQEEEFWKSVRTGKRPGAPIRF